MNPQEQITAFEAHLKVLNKAFDRAKSILKPVFDHLEEHKAEKLPKKFEKEQLTKLLKDAKGDDKKETYADALEEVERVWGTTEEYKQPPTSMGPADHIAALEAHLKALNKDFDKAKSVLKPLFDHLEKTKAEKPPKKLEKDQIKKLLEKATGNDKKETYAAALLVIGRIWGTTEPYKRTAAAVGGPPPLPFVRRVAPALEELKTFAPSDLMVGSKGGEPDWKTGLAGCANQPKAPDVLKRYLEHMKSAKAPTAGETGLKDPKLLTPGSDWEADQYAKVYEELKKAKAGTAAQFALAAAHVITHKQKEGPRVEIVAFKQKKDYTHYYLLVGRAGEDAKANKVPPFHMDREVVIVDGWAAAMGHDVAFKGFGSYPFAMTSGLLLVASWPPKDE